MSSKRPRRDSSEQSVPESTSEEEVQRPTVPQHRIQAQIDRPAPSQQPPSTATQPQHSFTVRAFNVKKNVTVKNHLDVRTPVQNQSAVQGKASTSTLIEAFKVGGEVTAGSAYVNMTGDNAAPSRTGTAQSGNSASKRKTIYDLKRPGNVLIINNKFTMKGGSMRSKRYKAYERQGWKKDEEDMRKLFADVLGCIVQDEEENVLTDELPDTLNEFKERCSNAGSSFLVVIVLTHGGPGDALLMHDLKPVSLFKDVVAPFNEGSFPEFKGKPKIFLIQTCTNFGDREGDVGVDISPPEEELADIFVGGAFLPFGFAWQRPDDADGPDTEAGGWYIRSIKDVFSNHWKSENLKSMHDLVGDMVEQIAERKNQELAESDQHNFQRPYKFCSDFGVFKFPPPTDDYNHLNMYMA